MKLCNNYKIFGNDLYIFLKFNDIMAQNVDSKRKMGEIFTDSVDYYADYVRMGKINFRREI